MVRYPLAFAFVLLLLSASMGQEMRGHGGPVRALAVSADGAMAISGSFDTSAIVWEIDQGRAVAVLRGHASSVNAVAALADGRFVTAGEDGFIRLWRPGSQQPERVIGAHAAPIASLAVSPDGRALASASWDGTARLTSLADAGERVVAELRGPVNAVGFTPDGQSLVVGGQDGAVRIIRLADQVSRSVETGVAVNALVVAADGEIVVGGIDGRLRLISARGDAMRALPIADAPLVAVALSPDGLQIAAAGVRGTVAIVDRASGRIERTLVGPGLPVWSLAFRPGTSELVTGGGDRLVRRWSVTTGEHLGEVVMSRPAGDANPLPNHPGAEVFRACAACHALTADAGARAGPTLFGVIGRRIGTAPGYDYSRALRGMDIIWTKETIARLFDIGPNAYTPGTKMPEQRVTDPDDLRDLVDYIAKATGAE